MKKRKIVMSVLIVTMLASCMACGNIKDHKNETLKNSVTEKVTVSDTEVAEDTENIEPVDIKIDDLKPLADAGVITGVEDIIVPEGTDESGNNSNNKPTEKPHVHKYNRGIVTKEPTCTDTGIKTYTCVDGDDSYTETIPALGHDYVTRTETVTIKEAWDEDVYEPRYICNGCGASFETAREVGRHILAVPNDTCGSYYVDDVKVNTIHHPAETETRTYKVCSRCGDTVK